MATRPVVHVFPGQGDFSITPLVAALDEPVVRRSFTQISTRVEEVAAEYGIPSLRALLLTGTPPDGHHLADLAPGTEQLALYVTQMTVHRALQEIGLAPDRVLGVSFGEITALAASGVCSIEDGARTAIRAARAMLHYPGGMTLLLTSPARTEEAIHQAGAKETTIACVNHASEVIVTAPDVRELDCLEQYAADNGIRAIRLPLPFRCHHPSLATEAEDLCRTMRRVSLRPATVPVYSAVHARAYTAGDDLLRCVADSLTRPFHLPDALTAAAPKPAALWLEVNSGKAFTRAARRTLHPPHTVQSPLADTAFTWTPDVPVKAAS